MPLPARCALVAVASLAGAILARALVIPGTAYGAVWFPFGVLVLGLVRSKVREWPWIAAASLAATAVVNLWVGHPGWLSAGFAIFDLAFAAAIAAAARRGRDPTLRLRAPGDLARFLGISAAGSALNAAAAMALVRLATGATPPEWTEALRALWAAELVGIMLVMPFARERDERDAIPRTRARVLEGLLLLVLLAGSSYASFFHLEEPALSHQFTLAPLLIWAAFRFRMEGAAVAGLLVTTFALLGVRPQLQVLAARGTSPLAVGGWVQLFVGLGLATYFVLAIISEDRRRALVEASTARARFERFLEHSPVFVFIKEPGGPLLAVSGNAAGLLGRPGESITGRPLLEFLPPEAAEQSRLLDQRALETGQAVESRYELRGVVWSVVRFPIPQSGGPPLIGGFATDVSEQRRTEGAARMASLGTLAAGVAHEINNPLAFVMANLDYVDDQLRRLALPELEEPIQALDEAREGARRVRDIVRDLKSFTRPAEPAQRELLDVRRPLRAALGLALNEVRHRARLEQELADVPLVLASEHQIAQVLLNLIVNAAQAIPEGRAGEHVITLRTGAAPDGQAFVEVSDTGGGMAPDVVRRIFDPFFTTKPVGSGTGLGLFVCEGIVKALGGRIEVRSELGRGSTFRVLLPAARRDAERAVEGAPAPRAGRARALRVLVVDDEPLVGRSIQRMLPGAQVESYVEPHAALERLARDDRWDAVLCDVMMPQMTGMEFHERLAGVAPGLRRCTIFITGGAFTPGAQAFLERRDVAQLVKPFDAMALRAPLARWAGAEPRGRDGLAAAQDDLPAAGA